MASSETAGEKMRGSALRGILLGAVVLAAIAAVPDGAAAADAPPPFWKECERGTARGQCIVPRGVGTAPGTAPEPGSVYVADQSNARVQEFTAWGEFGRTWGWGVASEGAAGSGDLNTGSA